MSLPNKPIKAERVKFAEPRGLMPSLQYLPPAMLQIDASYQRSMDGEASKSLVRAIATAWNWDLCQPLVVARRDDGGLFVIDGQHRLAAARLRGDIAQLPAVVVQYASAVDEAASFVQLNQARRPLTKMDLFKAAVASGDAEAVAILAAITEAGLSVAPHFNRASWKPGMIDNIGGVEACWRRLGPLVTRTALRVLCAAYPGVVLGYAGTLFPGIAAVVDLASCKGAVTFDEKRLGAMIRGKTQVEWRALIHAARGSDPNLNFARASEQVFLQAWETAKGSAFFTPDDPEDAGPKLAFDWLKAPAPAAKPAAKPEPERGKAPKGNTWCDQCDRNKTWPEIERCRDKFCSFGVKK